LQLIERQVHIIASDMGGDNIFTWQGVKSESIKALVIGNESKGISQEILDLATSVVSIPIIGGS
ncbi:MAG: TrmH family RNA methyltransferase, partial [Caldicoprobacterales bacterium]